MYLFIYYILFLLYYIIYYILIYINIYNKYIYSIFGLHLVLYLVGFILSKFRLGLG